MRYSAGTTFRRVGASSDEHMSRKPLAANVAPTPAANRERLAGMARVAQSFASFRPAVEVVRRVTAVPTIFPDLDRVLGVGGLPTDRVIVVHGPSNKGKTAMTLGLGLSFLRRDHFFGLVDAEQSTPVEWLTDLYGETFQHPGFAALPIGTYEQVRGGVRDFFQKIAAARARGDIPPDTRALCLVDSLKKLVPAKVWEMLQKAMKADLDDEAPKKKARFGGKGKSSGGVDAMGGRLGQIKAQYNSAWMDELTPLLAQTNGTIVLIGRETLTAGTGMFDKDEITLGGGKDINFEASLRLRVDSKALYDGSFEAKTSRYIGELHTVDVMKTKIHGKQEAVPTAVFHSSNGVASPAGFDHARDLLACAVELGVVTMAGSYFKCDGVPGVVTLGQGMDNALVKLRTPKVSEAVEYECRARMVASTAA